MSNRYIDEVMSEYKQALKDKDIDTAVLAVNEAAAIAMHYGASEALSANRFLFSLARAMRIPDQVRLAAADGLVEAAACIRIDANAGRTWADMM